MSESDRESGDLGLAGERPRKERVLIEVAHIDEVRGSRHAEASGSPSSAGTGRRLCGDAHVGHVVSGSLHVELEGGEGLDLRRGGMFVIPPGHDDWAGNEPCDLVRIDEATSDDEGTSGAARLA